MTKSGEKDEKKKYKMNQPESIQPKKFLDSLSVSSCAVKLESLGCMKKIMQLNRASRDLWIYSWFLTEYLKKKVQLQICFYN